MQILGHGATGVVSVNHRDAQTSSHDQCIWGIACPRLEGHDAPEGTSKVVLQFLHGLDQGIVAHYVHQSHLLDLS